MRLVVVDFITFKPINEVENETTTILINPEFVVALYEGKATRGKNKPTTLISLLQSEGDSTVDIRALGDMFSIAKALTGEH